MSPTIQYASFLIRLWREADGDAASEPADWRGEIEHIQTGERWNFETRTQLLDFLRRETERDDEHLVPRDRQ